MHEIGYCDGVLEVVERRAKGRRVARIGVRIGAKHRVVPEAFEQSFRHVAEGGVADGATTQVVTVPATALCRACSTSFPSRETMPDCPSCGAPVLELEGGDEVVLEWVEYHPDGTGGAAHVPRHPG